MYAPAVTYGGSTSPSNKIRSTVPRAPLFHSKVLLPIPNSSHATYCKQSTSKLPYASEIRAVQWNVEDIRQAGLQQQIVREMRTHNWHIMFVSETHLTSPGQYVIDGYHFMFSSAPDCSSAGVGVVIAPWLRPFILSFTAHSARICEVRISSQGAPVVIFGVYAPTQQDDAETAAAREAFWSQLETLVRPIPSTTFWLIVGDLNVRLQGRLRGEEAVLGPHLFGLGAARAAGLGPRTNRHHLMHLCTTHGWCLANTFKTPNVKHRVSYREIWTPPGFSTDPRLHQTLDHIVCSRRWLPSVLSTRTHPHIFNPHASHHFPMLCCFRVKLGAPKPRSVRPPPLDWRSATDSQLAEFNEAVRTELEKDTDAVDTVPLPAPSPGYECFTDGSATRGVRGAPAEAGWGFVVRRQGLPDITSYAKVDVDCLSQFNLGASSRTNNTAELSAIIELFLWLLEYASPMSLVVITYDSKYAANIARGKWSPSSNKKIAALARSMWERVRIRFEVQWVWVKGHSGDSGNEAADRAADLGRNSCAHEGRFGLEYAGPFLYAACLPEPPPDFLPGESLSNEAKQLSRALTAAAGASIPVRPSRPRNKWISRGTLALMEEQREAVSAGDQVKLTELYASIRKSVRRDKRVYAREQFRVAAAAGEKEAFAELRRKRGGFPSSTTKLVYAGKTFAAEQIPNGLATYLEEVPWASPPPSAIPPVRPPRFPPALLDESPFSPEELDGVIAAMKPGRQGGEDKATHEMLRSLDERNRASVRTFINKVWLSGSFPDPWRKAVVAEIFKGGGKDITNPASYRPISLLSVIYKLYARLVQVRLAQGIDHRIRDRQYGFRKGRSTGDPIHIVRRVQELFESTSSPLYLLFLDWQQAFDRLSREGLLSALRRIGCTPHYVKVIESMYAHTSFVVRTPSGCSTEHCQHSGIRQGCPLSPYLFVVFMSVFMDDIEDRYVEEHGTPPRVHTAQDPLFDLEYADDVVLLTRTRAQLQRLLSMIEEEASLYAMRLNQDKVKLVAMNPVGAAPLLFGDGGSVGEVTSWPYLGSRISRDAKQGVNLAARLSHATREFDKLVSFWAHAAIPTSLKLRTFKAIFHPMVTYALHYSWLTKSMSSRLDAWQARMLRRVLRIKASMISRVSNSVVLKRAGCTPLSDFVRSERIKYFGHVLRRDYADTIANVVVDSSFKLRAPAGRRLRRRPLDNWPKKTSAEVLDIASRRLPLSVRPASTDRPATSGILYARRLALDKEMWKRLHDRRTDAPTGGRAGARARPGRVAAAPASTPPGGAG